MNRAGNEDHCFPLLPNSRTAIRIRGSVLDRSRACGYGRNGRIVDVLQGQNQRLSLMRAMGTWSRGERRAEVGGEHTSGTSAGELGGGGVVSAESMGSAEMVQRE